MIHYNVINQPKNHGPVGLDPRFIAEAGADSRVLDESGQWLNSGQSPSHVPLAGCPLARSRFGAAY